MTPPSGRTCGACGEPLPDAGVFCSHCGALAEGGAGSPTPPGVSPETRSGQAEAGAARTPSAWERLLPDVRAATAPKYRILRLLGWGGMAGVYLAEEPRLGRRVAVKVISPGLMVDPSQVERFVQEARTTAQLNHPHIVTIYDVDERENLHYFTMRYVGGRSLGHVMDRATGPLPVPVVKTWLAQVAGALAYAHRRGVVHRDIKPGNILLDETGNALVTDFGIAKVADEPGLTKTGILVGTPAYMSPEQCSGSPVTGASDQYSLGAVAYQMLTGTPPFTGPTMAVIQSHLSDRPPPLGERRPDAPVELVATVERMLEKGVEDRWPDLDAAADALAAPVLRHGDPLRLELSDRAAWAGSVTLSADRAIRRRPAPSEPVTVGDTFQVTAVVRTTTDRPLADRRVDFRTEPQGILEIDADGRVRAVAPGSARIEARCDGAQDELVVEVLAARAPAVPEEPPTEEAAAAAGPAGDPTWVRRLSEPTPDPAAPVEPAEAGPGEGPPPSPRPAASTPVPSAEPPPRSPATPTPDGPPSRGATPTPAPPEPEPVPHSPTPAPTPRAARSPTPGPGGRPEKRTGRTIPVWVWGGGGLVAAAGVAAVLLSGGGADTPGAPGPETSETVQASRPAGEGAAAAGDPEGVAPDDAPGSASEAGGDGEALLDSGSETAGGESDLAPDPAAATDPAPDGPAVTPGGEEAAPDETGAGSPAEREDRDPPAPSEPPPVQDGTLVLPTGLPEGVRVTIRGEGQLRRVTSGPVSLPPGNYELELTGTGYETERGRVTLEPGGTARWVPTPTRVAPPTPEPETGATDETPPPGPAPEEAGATDPDPEAVARAIVQALEAFGSALQARDMDAVRAAYPGIPDDQARGWEQFVSSRDIRDLRVAARADGAPRVDGDRAEVGMLLELRYENPSQPAPSDPLRYSATLERQAPGRWVIAELVPGG